VRNPSRSPHHGIKARCILEALDAGEERVHILDGRQPHTIVAELFTDRGVGTLVTRSGAQEALAP